MIEPVKLCPHLVAYVQIFYKVKTQRTKSAFRKSQFEYNTLYDDVENAFFKSVHQQLRLCY